VGRLMMGVGTWVLEEKIIEENFIQVPNPIIN
jgi:hypothetical protein